MNWITVLYNSNQNYIVQEQAILDVVNSVILRFKTVKLTTKPKLVFDNEHTNVQLGLEIKLKAKDKSYYSVIKDLSNQLEEAIKQLIDVKPKNIQIAITEFL
ncbi:MMB_0454 family protein [Mycoplasma hafezii]|uniref:MMB_0454 family protein n=1 Tax=Mycoplasma hafezii TaxID=525886 RepID=UPI003CEC0040